MSKFKDNFKEALANKPLQYVIVIGGLLLLVYLVGKAAGKRSVSGTQVPYQKGDDVTESWVNTVAPVIVREMYDSLVFFNSMEGKVLAMQRLEGLSDGQLKYCYNLYNRSFHPEGKQTLTTDLRDIFVLLGYGTADEIRDRIVLRLEGLGMK
nr:hypothetical protein [uncultured Arsenicibacter sp.]